MRTCGPRGGELEDQLVTSGGHGDGGEFDPGILPLRVEVDLGQHGAAGADPQGGEVGRGGDGEPGLEADRSGQPVQEVERRGVSLHPAGTGLQRRPAPAGHDLQRTGDGDKFRFRAEAVIPPRRRPFRRGGSPERRQELEVVGGHGEAVGHGQVQLLQGRDPEGGGTLEAVSRLRPPEMERVRGGARNDSVRGQDPDRLPEAGARVRKVLQQIEQGDDLRAAAGEGEFLGVSLHQEGARRRVLGKGVVAQIQPHRPAAGAPDRLRQVAVSATQLQQQALRLQCIQQLDPGVPVRMRPSVTLGRVAAGLAVEVVVIVEAAVPAKSGRIVRTSSPGSHDWPARYHGAETDSTTGAATFLSPTGAAGAAAFLPPTGVAASSRRTPKYRWSRRAWGNEPTRKRRKGRLEIAPPRHHYELGVCAVEMIVARKWGIEARVSRFGGA